MTDKKKLKRMARERAKRLGITYRTALFQIAGGDANLRPEDLEAALAPVVALLRNESREDQERLLNWLKTRLPDAVLAAKQGEEALQKYISELPELAPEPPSQEAPSRHRYSSPDWHAVGYGFRLEGSKFAAEEKRHPTKDRKLVFRKSAYFGRIGPREIIVQVGRRYMVDQLNKQAKKHRGRPCEITELDDNFMPDRAAVKFLDAEGRWAIIQLSDLRELEAHEREALMERHPPARPSNG